MNKCTRCDRPAGHKHNGQDVCNNCLLYATSGIKAPADTAPKAPECPRTDPQPELNVPDGLDGQKLPEFLFGDWRETAVYTPATGLVTREQLTQQIRENQRLQEAEAARMASLPMYKVRR
jgi:hypothetical protein